jgi:hypothetical protein
MLDRNGKLEIFDNFVVDRRLPKFKAGRKELGQAMSQKKASLDGEEDEGEDISESVTMASNDFSRAKLIHVEDGKIIASPSRRGWFRRLLPRWKKEETPPPATMSIEDFFGSVKDSVAQVVVVGERAAGYKLAIVNARKAGQIALAEQLDQGLMAARSEAQLLAMGLGKYLEEATVAELVAKVAKGKSLRLDWVRNFVRIMPAALIALKQEADERLIFDNYAIMHYDPLGAGRAPTKEEVRSRKDPILFGLIEGRRRLYYVGDWVDEFCDLTLDQVADTLGTDSIKSL